MNECGQSSAALNFQFAVTLKNVFDTQVFKVLIVVVDKSRVTKQIYS